MYPISTDYITSVKSLSIMVDDPVLRKGKAQTQKNNPQFPLIYSGGFACVFRINVNGDSYAMRCWTGNPDNIEKRYYEIDLYLKQIKSPYFVEFSYIKSGILVNGVKYPIIRQKWINGYDLKGYIAKNLTNPNNLYQLADNFLTMASSLHQHNISHGDLQHENIRITNSNQVLLIDYDSLYVPKLKNEKDAIKGIQGFQHPKRKEINKLSKNVDYFSELVIYISIVAIAERPKFWNEIKDYNRLLFSEDDFLKPANSKIFLELKKMSQNIRKLTNVLKSYCYKTNLNDLKPLEEILLDLKLISSPSKKPEWDLPNPPPKKEPQKPYQPPTLGTSLWDKINSSKQPNTSKKNNWDLFDNQKSSNDIWNKFNKIEKPSTNFGSQPTNDKIWDKFINTTIDIWDKIETGITDIWTKLKNWLKKI